MVRRTATWLLVAAFALACDDQGNTQTEDAFRADLGVAFDGGEEADERVPDAAADAVTPDAGDAGGLDVGDDREDGAVDGAPPDGPLPDVVEPDVAELDVGRPDGDLPDVAMGDGALPDVAVPDVAPPDLDLPDLAPPDAGLPDRGVDPLGPLLSNVRLTWTTGTSAGPGATINATGVETIRAEGPDHRIEGRLRP